MGGGAYLYERRLCEVEAVEKHLAHISTVHTNYNHNNSQLTILHHCYLGKSLVQLALRCAA
jgi:hypothetical protein